jgi:hypothetical protein
VSRPDWLAEEDVLVADVERLQVASLALDLRRLVLGREGDRAAVGAPGELLDARGRAREAERFAAAELEEPDLLEVLRVGREERERASVRRPRGRRDLRAAEGQRSRRPRGDVDGAELRLVPVLREVRARRDHGDGLPVGRDLDARDADELAQVLEREGVLGGGPREGDEQDGEQDGGSHGAQRSGGASPRV